MTYSMYKVSGLRRLKVPYVWDSVGKRRPPQKDEYITISFKLGSNSGEKRLGSI